MRAVTYHVRLPYYEGPLALLVHLIESQELDIWNIPIAQITDQYLAYLAAMEELNLEIGGEFLVMAATLLAIKAHMLLPREEPTDEAPPEEPEEDPRDELVRRLLEYRKFREAGRYLAERLGARGIVAGRGAPPPPGTVRYADPAGNATVADLVRAYQRVLEAGKEAQPLPLPRYTVTVEDRVEEILRLFRRQKRVCFLSLCKPGDRRHVVVTFLAILELVRQGVAVVQQEGLFGPITLERVEEPSA